MSRIKSYNPTQDSSSAASQETTTTTPKPETIVKQKKSWVRNPQENFGQENVQPGDNTRYLRFSRMISNLPPINIEDPNQIEARINEYFDYCEQNDMKPGMVGMASALGVSHATLDRWKRGDYRAETHCEMIKKAVISLEALWEQYMQNGKINPASGIFLGKNMFGYRDVIDIAPTQAPPLGEIEDKKQLEDRINGTIIED